MAQWLLLGGFPFPPILLPCELSAPYLPKFFSGPLAFLGHYTTRSRLSNSVTLVAIGPAVVEEFEFCQREVFLGSFACILGLDFRVDCISSYHSAAFPSPIPFTSTPDLSLFGMSVVLDLYLWSRYWYATLLLSFNAFQSKESVTKSRKSLESSAFSAFSSERSTI
ncbi:hypothetical protein EDD15DRAFT_1438152 [Pisolithus albus]|nr:hypothetical protein EDD15DRAFT_1438152 [Pisolithus albus]